MKNILSFILISFFVHAAHSQSSEYLIVVNTVNLSSVIDRKSLSEIFLKKITQWPNGELILPVDLPSASQIRRLFSDKVHRRAIMGVKSYWQQRIFSGRGVPPPELATDEDVINYIKKHPGGIGYVSSTANVKNVKVLQVQ